MRVGAPHASVSDISRKNRGSEERTSKYKSERGRDIFMSLSGWCFGIWKRENLFALGKKIGKVLDWGLKAL
jgi:hypothetical protein